MEQNKRRMERVGATDASLLPEGGAHASHDTQAKQEAIEHGQARVEVVSPPACPRGGGGCGRKDVSQEACHLLVLLLEVGPHLGFAQGNGFEGQRGHGL